METVQFRIAGKVALVTGGGSGIGRAIALGLAGAGLEVGVGDILPDRVASTVGSIKKMERRSYGLAGDVGRLDDVRRLVGEVGDRLGPIDVLVNCAGIFPRSSVVEMAEEEWDRVLDTNVKSVFLISQAVLPGMLARGYGRIISITSDLALTGAQRGAHYAASKGAINAFTRSLAREVADDGIMVNAIAPGLTDTPMMRGANSPEYIAALSKTMPGGRLGQPEDVVGMALFLVSEEARDVTGQVFKLRG